MKSKALLAAVLLTAAAALAQEFGAANDVPLRDRQFVSYAAERQTVVAGKRATLDLHFRVAEGFHVNSHTPNSDLLIATLLEIEPSKDSKPADAIFPAGTLFSFDFAPKEKLDVYQGPFTVGLPVVASAGAHRIEATLTYQACNRHACFPPRSLPVLIDFVAK